MNLKRLRELQESLEVYGELDEAEGSYGRTPKAEKAFKDLYAKRLNTGGNRKSVGDARKHAFRVNDPDKGHTGRKSPRPVEGGTFRRRMTQSDRDVGRQSKEYDPDDLYFGPQSDGPKGSLPRSAKKRQRQKMTGVSAESYNIYDILISHLLDEGYAEDVKNAYCILENMSEEWVLEILDEELTGERKKRAMEKAGGREALGKIPMPLAARIAVGKEGKPLEVARKDPRTSVRTTTKGPTKRGGSGFRGRSKSDWQGVDDAHGSGNKAARRAGKEVKDTSDEL